MSFSWFGTLSDLTLKRTSWWFSSFLSFLYSLARASFVGGKFIFHLPFLFVYIPCSIPLCNDWPKSDSSVDIGSHTGHWRWNSNFWDVTLSSHSGGWGGGGVYKLYRYVPPHQVGFLHHFGLELGMVFEGTKGVYERSYPFNSKWKEWNRNMRIRYALFAL